MYFHTYLFFNKSDNIKEETFYFEKCNEGHILTPLNVKNHPIERSFLYIKFIHLCKFLKLFMS